MQHTPSAYATKLSITFGAITTDNHFALDRGGVVFNASSPVIKLRSAENIDAHFEVLGNLNSSASCFWMKQIFYPKAGSGMGRGIQPEPWMERFAYDGTKLEQIPLPRGNVADVARTMDKLARDRRANITEIREATGESLTRAGLDSKRELDRCLRSRMCALQEELDWRVYAHFGLVDESLCFSNEEGYIIDPPEIELGERAFEIALARKIESGEIRTAWFERHRSKPTTEIPSHWPNVYRELVVQRIALIESDRYIGLIERPEYKRRWNQEPWDEEEKSALQSFLLDRLEQGRYWPEPRLQSARSLAAQAEIDMDFMKVAELYVGHPGFDVPALVTELVEREGVPFLPVLRYKAAGLRKREVWEQTWGLQRSEDAIDAQVATELTKLSGETDEEYENRLQSEQLKRKKAEIGDIASPTKYRSADFIVNTYWRLRGPLDLTKERFVSYPHCSRENDSSLVVGWAGWNHLQQAQALAGYYTEMVEQEGWQAERLKPLLAGIGELLPWLKQWHNDIDPTFNERMGDFFETFLRSEMQKHGLTREDLSAWKPPVTATRRRRRRA